MPQQALLKALEDDARRQAAEIVERAEKEAAEIIERAEREAAEVGEARLAELSARLGRERTGAVNAARVRVRAEGLKVRHELVDEVFRAVVDRFARLPRSEYADLLRRLYEEAREDAHVGPDGGPVAYVNPSDVELLEGVCPDVRADERVTAGVVVSDPEGRVRSENTIASRLEKGRDVIVPLVDRLLFE